ELVDRGSPVFTVRSTAGAGIGLVEQERLKQRGHAAASSVKRRVALTRFSIPLGRARGKRRRIRIAHQGVSASARKRQKSHTLAAISPPAIMSGGTPTASPTW